MELERHLHLLSATPHTYDGKKKKARGDNDEFLMQAATKRANKLQQIHITAFPTAKTLHLLYVDMLTYELLIRNSSVNISTF